MWVDDRDVDERGVAGQAAEDGLETGAPPQVPVTVISWPCAVAGSGLTGTTARAPFGGKAAAGADSPTRR
ncbi:hypothetical protein [Amycolatopsis sp. FDAARGOS 1241]|uniref:hypothetical protein n=1 Tax=Amycolatopsis sp. FDAARGOS 1241 TaxID=2778070 RepID=UPI0019521D99|nr:hypothetical protein [Amycolatopsis sp. FDAARGOS 1241]QRP49097.1 hypothetical protein I6J71_15665 [Amycolatopsis sp. FDAARGOS 1241]